MGKTVLKNGIILLGSHDASAQHSSIGLTQGLDVKEATTFNATGTKEKVAGLPDNSFEGGGYHVFGASDAQPDKALMDTSAGIFTFEDLLVQMGEEGNASGAQIYFMAGVHGEYKITMSVGEVIAFTVSGESNGKCIYGHCLGKGTGAGNGTPYHGFATSAAQTLWGGLNCTAFDGTSLDVLLKSDTVENFGGTPETRITFAQLTDVGYELASDPGASLDTWYRYEATFVGTSVAFTVSMGIRAT
jgi:hypothetical protein